MNAVLRALVAGQVLALACAAPLAAELGLSLDYVDTSSPQYQAFASWVDAAVAGSPGYAFSATDAAYMYRLTGSAPYATLALAMVEAQVAAAEIEIDAGRAPEIAGDSYLEVGPMLRDLAVVYAWCGPTPAQKTRWAAYAEQAVWNVWHPDAASWGGNAFPWSGWSIDNPGNNYHFSFLEATMYWGLADDDPTTGEDWIAFLGEPGGKLSDLVAYWLQVPGGGSREGTGYGVALMRLFEIYRVWRDSTGTNLAAASTHLADTLDYWVHATVPTRDRYAPIGDLARESYPNLFDYHRVLVLQARAMAPSGPPAAHAAAWLDAISIGAMTQGFNRRHDLLTRIPAALPAAPAARFHHATGTGHLFARSDWTADAMWMSFVAGRYDESHAHQDQGAFNLFRGDWLAVSENIWSHSGIVQEVVAHNTLRFVDGTTVVTQRQPTTSTMTVDQVGDTVHVAADLAPAYAPTGRVSAWTRTLDLDRFALTVRDAYAVAGGVAAVFQVQTPAAPVVDGNSVIAGPLRIRVLVPAAPTFAVLDWTTVDPGELDTVFYGGYRVDIGGGTGEYLVRLELAAGVFADGFESGTVARWSGAAP